MNAPSPSPSPVMAGTPESTPSMSSSSTSYPRITSWLPGTADNLYPVESTEWAGTTSPTRSPQSHSPPPSANGGRRNTLPQRKAESKLRSVLPAIDEKQNKPDSLSSRVTTPPDTTEVKTPLARPALTSTRTSTFSNIATTSISSSLDSLSPPPLSQESSTSSHPSSTAPEKTPNVNGLGSLIGGGGGVSSAFNGFGFGTWNFGYGQSPYNAGNVPDDDSNHTHTPESTTEASTPRMSATTAGITPSTTASAVSPPLSNLDLKESEGGESGNEKRDGSSDRKVEGVYDSVSS